MATFTTLPAELRQQMLRFTFPDATVINESLPAQITTLIQISRTICSDTLNLITTWSPTHYINNPSQTAGLTPPTISIDSQRLHPRLDRVALNIFHQASNNVIFQTCECQMATYGFHYDLMAAWRASIIELPAHLSSIALDITPVPAATRRMHRLAFRSAVQDRRTQNFAYRHLAYVAGIIEDIMIHYSGKIKLELFGTVGTPRSVLAAEMGQTWPDIITSHWRNTSLMPDTHAIDIPFTGTIVSREQARIPHIRNATESLRPKRLHSKAERARFAKFHTIQWSHATRWTYAKLVDEGDGRAVEEDIRAICEFEVGDGEELSFGCVRAKRRAFVHCVARDLGLGSCSLGEGGERYVVVRRRVSAGEDGDGSGGEGDKQPR